jgi:hypothetical protein
MLVTKRAVPLAVTRSDTNMKAPTSKLNQTIVGHASRLSTRYIERTCLDNVRNRIGLHLIVIRPKLLTRSGCSLPAWRQTGTVGDCLHAALLCAEMQNSPSLTSKTAALVCAAHQVREGGSMFLDPLALPICGEDAGTPLYRVRLATDPV